MEQIGVSHGSELELDKNSVDTADRTVEHTISNVSLFALEQ